MPVVPLTERAGSPGQGGLRPAAAGLAAQLALGLLLAAAAIGLRWLLDPVLGSRQPYTPAYGLVAVAVWYGGWRCALATLVACHLAATYWFVPPRGVWVWSAQEFVGSATYYTIGGIIIFLGHRATSANRALMAALAELRKSDERRSRFLAVLAHELRNPLAVINNGLGLLASEKLGPPERQATGRMMQRQVQQMGHLVDDLLDVTRIDQGKIALRRRRVAVASVVREAAASARSFTDARQQTIDAVVPADDVEIEIDADRIHQALVNLLHNASKFSADGTRIALAAAADDRDVVLTVSDGGIGIPTERLESIFEPFVQLDEPGHHHHGLGLGLWLVRNLVELHGGSISAQSVGPGQGASFVVRLPRGVQHA